MMLKTKAVLHQVPLYVDSLLPFPLEKGAAVLSDVVIIQSLCCSLLRLLRGCDFPSLITKTVIHLNNFQFSFHFRGHKISRLG